MAMGADLTLMYSAGGRLGLICANILQNSLSLRFSSIFENILSLRFSVICVKYFLKVFRLRLSLICAKYFVVCCLNLRLSSICANILQNSFLLNLGGRAWFHIGEGSVRIKVGKD